MAFASGASLGGISGWVAKLGSFVDDITNTYITNVVSTLTKDLVPLALALLTLWWILMGWSVMRGQSSLAQVFWKGVKSSLIVTFALNTGLYNDQVVNSARGLRDDMAAEFLSAAVTTPEIASATSIWEAIDNMSEVNYNVLNEASKDISMWNFPAYIALALMDVGFLILGIMCVVLAFLSQMYFTFFIGIGPIFILCLLFPPTQRFFDGWLGMMLNTVVLTWIGMFVISFAVNISTKFATVLAGEWSLVNPVITSLQYCALCVVLAITIYQAPSWAAALTGGSSMQMGMGMARDASAMFRDWRGYGKNNNNNSPNPNLIQKVGLGQRAMQGAAYGAGRVSGAVARVARYRMAAMRGKG